MRCIIAPSYADIFYNNCFKNGVLPVVLSADEVEELFRKTLATEGFTLKIDLAAQEIAATDGARYPFEVDSFRKHCMLNGLDDIGLTMENEAAIRAFEDKWQQQSPWLFNVISER